MYGIRSYAKFFVKSRIVMPLRAFLVRFFVAPVHTEAWEQRLLIVNLQALGDLIVFTGVLKQYRKRFPGVKIYLLIKKGIGIEPFLAPAFVDEIIAVDYRRFAVNPFYGAEVIAMLRRIGFEKVINQDFSAAEIMGKIISLNLGAKEVIGYEGIGLEFRHPFDIQQKKNLKIVRHRINPRYTTLVPSLDQREPDAKAGKLPSTILQYARVYEVASNAYAAEYAPVLPEAESNELEGVLTRFGLARGHYAVLNVNASVAYKRWPLERFAKIADFLQGEGLRIVLVGSRGEREFTEKFEKLAPGIEFINTAGQTSLTELFALVAASFLVVSSDTSLTHISVALKKPSVIISGGGVFGMFSNYGYTDINRYLYTRTPCYCDNWECSRRLTAGEPVPCVAAVLVEQVLRELRSLIEYLRGAEREGRHVPGEPFRVEW